MLVICLSLLLIGCGFLGKTPAFSCRAPVRATRATRAQSRRPTGMSWPSASTSRPREDPRCPVGTGAAFTRVVSPARAALGTAVGRLSEPTPWSSLSINHDDPVKVHLAARLQQSALAHVADSTAHAYVSPWNAFVRWCGALARPRRTLRVDELTVDTHMPTHAPEVTMVRRAAMRKFGLAPHSRKAPFKWELTSADFRNQP